MRLGCCWTGSCSNLAGSFTTTQFSMYFSAIGGELRRQRVHFSESHRLPSDFVPLKYCWCIKQTRCATLLVFLRFTKLLNRLLPGYGPGGNGTLLHPKGGCILGISRPSEQLACPCNPRSQLSPASCNDSCSGRNGTWRASVARVVS